MKFILVICKSTFYADDSLLIPKSLSSRKKPKMDYWFYNIPEPKVQTSPETDEASVNSLLTLLQKKGIPSGNIHINSSVQGLGNEFANFLINVSK